MRDSEVHAFLCLVPTLPITALGRSRPAAEASREVAERWLLDGSFRWRDSAHHNEQKLLTLSLDEFLRRFLLHILPKSFVRIRNFGFLANRKRASLLPLRFHLLGATSQPHAEPTSSTQDPPSWRCPKCGGPMRVIQHFTAAELQLRSPPKVTAAA